MFLLKILLTGLVYLILALAVNYLAFQLKLTSWYDFAQSIGRSGILKALNSLTLESKLWLFLIYPFILGFFVYLLRKYI